MKRKRIFLLIGVVAVLLGCSKEALYNEENTTQTSKPHLKSALNCTQVQIPAKVCTRTDLNCAASPV